MYSCAFVHLSVTLSGIGFGFAHIMSCRRYQPSACSAKATRQGTPMMSLGFRPETKPTPSLLEFPPFLSGLPGRHRGAMCSALSYALLCICEPLLISRCEPLP